MRYRMNPGALLPLLALVACAHGGGDPSTPASATSAWQDVEWTLVELNGAPIAAAEGGRGPTLLLAAADRRASGHAGCNRMTGTYESSGEGLRFGAMATTKMYCPAMDLEQKYLAALEATRSHRAAAGGLELLDANGAAVAKFGRP